MKGVASALKRVFRREKVDLNLEPMIWSDGIDTDELKRLSEDALEQIEKSDLFGTPQWVCHHFNTEFDWAVRSKDDPVFIPLKNALSDIGLELQVVGHEAWETAVVDADWIANRPSQVMAAAHSANCTYSGWSWEPKTEKLISATTFYIQDNRGLS